MLGTTAGATTIWGVGNIRAQEISLRQLLEGFKMYRVPLFQRPYVWGKHNWETLWEDIVGTYDAGDTPYRHFLGPILTVAHEATPDGFAPFTIVDGQQRLVTISLLLAAIRDRANQNGLKPLPEILDDLLLNRHATTDSDRLKVHPSRTDALPFRRLVLKQFQPFSNSSSSSSIERVYNFFSQKLDLWLGGSNHELQKLANTILDRVVVVHITLGEKDSAYRIFESLNYKGVPLTLADLVRNHLFMYLPLDKQESVYGELWGPLEERYKQAFSPTNKKPVRYLEELSDGIWHYVRIGGAEIRRVDTYAALVQRHQDYKSQGKSSEDFIWELSESLNDYLAFIRPEFEKDDSLKDVFRNLRALGFGVVAPLVMVLKRKLRQQDSFKPKALDLLRALEAYYVHRLVAGAGLDARPLGRVVLEILRKGILEEEDPVQQLKEFLKGRADQTRWPSRGEVESGLFRTNIRGAAPYLLRRLEEYLWKREQRKETPNLEGLTVEHVMPQRLDETWKKDLGENWDQIHRQYLHTLPNLTLTGYNPNMGNKSYAEKLPYLRESDLSINREYFGKQAPELWDEKAIRDRGNWLLDLIYQVWPE